jgi:hypothetical protein
MENIMKNLLLTLLLLIATVSVAQDATTSFWKSNRALIITDAAFKGTDAYFTHRALIGKTIGNGCRPNGQCMSSITIPGRELNPMAAPFVKTTAGQVAFFSASLAEDVGLAYPVLRMTPPL